MIISASKWLVAMIAVAAAVVAGCSVTTSGTPTDSGTQSAVPGGAGGQGGQGGKGGKGGKGGIGGTDGADGLPGASG